MIYCGENFQLLYWQKSQQRPRSFHSCIQRLQQRTICSFGHGLWLHFIIEIVNKYFRNLSSFIFLNWKKIFKTILSNLWCPSHGKMLVFDMATRELTACLHKCAMFHAFNPKMHSLRLRFPTVFYFSSLLLGTTWCIWWLIWLFVRRFFFFIFECDLLGFSIFILFKLLNFSNSGIWNLSYLYILPWLSTLYYAQT